jgi:integrase
MLRLMAVYFGSCGTMQPELFPNRFGLGCVAYIRKFRDKWQAQVEKHGHRAAQLFDTKIEAQRWGHAKELELDALKGSKGKTFDAAVTYYLQTVSSTKRAGAVEWERRRFAAMQAHFGPKAALSKIDSAAVGKWRDERLKTVSGATVLREVNLLRNLFKLAKNEWKWISHEPFQGVRLPEEAQARQTVWRWPEIRRVLRYCQAGGPKQQEVGRAFHIALRTAMRMSEVLKAPELLDRRGRVVVLPSSKTTEGVQKVPLTRQGLQLLESCPPFKVGANEASVLFAQACQGCGVRRKGVDGATFHDARATALTLLARKVDVMTLSRISRHRDIDLLTRVYYRETAEEIAARL